MDFSIVYLAKLEVKLDSSFVIVCADKTLRNDVAKILAKKNQMLNADIQDVIDYEILNHHDITLSEANEFLGNLEKKAIVKTLGYKNTVLSISCDTFVANDNFELFKNRVKVYVRLPKRYIISKLNKNNKDKIEQQLLMYNEIDALISCNCDITMDKELKTAQELVDEILGKSK